MAKQIFSYFQIFSHKGVESEQRLVMLNSHPFVFVLFYVVILNLFSPRSFSVLGFLSLSLASQKPKANPTLRLKPTCLFLIPFANSSKSLRNTKTIHLTGNLSFSLF